MRYGIEILGLFLALIDFLGLRARIEQKLRLYKERWGDEIGRYHFHVGGYLHWPTIYRDYRWRMVAMVLLLAAVNMTVIGGGLIAEGSFSALEFFALAVLLAAVSLSLWPLIFLSYAVYAIVFLYVILYPLWLTFHLLDKPRAGMVGTFGLVLAATAVLLNRL